MKHWALALFCAAFAWTVSAEGASQVRQRAEATMLVTGWIEVNPDGSVHDCSIDKVEKLPPVVADMVRKNVPTWRFNVDGNQNVIERAKMNLRVVAKRVDDTHDSLSIVGASFGDGKVIPGEDLTENTLRRPEYPKDAVRAHITGTVYLLLKVGRDGSVTDVAAQQVNLGEYADDNDMRTFRRLLAEASVRAAKHWTFNVPTHGKQAEQPYWLARVPVNYSVGDRDPRELEYGKWVGYIPGPRESIPWAVTSSANDSSDSIPAGSISMVGRGPQLATPLAGG